jgi:hypothetical protein
MIINPLISKLRYYELSGKIATKTFSFFAVPFPSVLLAVTFATNLLPSGAVGGTN